MFSFGTIYRGFNWSMTRRTVLSRNGRRTNSTPPVWPIRPSFMANAVCPTPTSSSRPVPPLPSSKFFVWLALLDRCWTGDRLLRHHMKDDASCILCYQADESIDHLLLGCCYTREVWARLLVRSGRHDVCPLPGDRIADWWIASEKKFVKNLRKGFDSLVVLVWWLV
jgi:hypothetical protein